jgi:hypothetical protein
MGRQFELWDGETGWKKLKKAVMNAVFGYAKAYAEKEGVPLDVMMQAHLLKVRRMFELDINKFVSAFILTTPSPPRVNTQMPPRCAKTFSTKQLRLLLHANSV